MKCLLALLTLFLTSTEIDAQQYSYVDIPPNQKENYLPYEGGSYLNVIDWSTPLNILIKRLNNKWRLEETGKGYWIGYTNDMFSIAARKDSAILPLLNFIDTSSNNHSKKGAIYCLHLIGINSTIVGRYYEIFTNKKAREALITSLKHDDLRSLIVELLIRDPWKSDIPKLFKALENCKSECWAIVNIFSRYQLDNLPIDQPIPDTLKDIYVRIRYAEPDSTNRTFFSLEKQFHEVLDSFKNLQSNFLLIEDTLLNSKLLGSTKARLNHYYNGNKVYLEDLIRSIIWVDYLHYGDKIQYYVEDGKLFLCSPYTAKNKLLNWWNSKSIEYKKQFEQNVSVIRKNKP